VYIYIYIHTHVHTYRHISSAPAAGGLVPPSRNASVSGQGTPRMELKQRNTCFAPSTDSKGLKETQPEVGWGKRKEKSASLEML